MLSRSASLNPLRATLAIALLVVAWLALGPSQLGGPTTYAVIEGNSMEPELSAGDLVLVRDKDSYEVGDVVAYRSGELNRLVLHRVIEQNGPAFTLQGDNNDFVDSAHPTEEQIAGKLAVTIPKAGTLVSRLKSPTGYAILFGLTGLTLVSARRARRRHSDDPAEPQHDSNASAINRTLARRRFDTLAGIAGGALVVCAIFTAYAYTRPPLETTTDPELYQQTGTFSYAADVGNSPVYNSPIATDSEALFTALANQVDVRFAYSLNADEAQRTSGTASLVATVSDGNGLERDVVLVGSQPFADGSVTLDGRFTLGSLLYLTRRIEALTGAAHESYTVTIRPSIEVSGHVGNTAIEDSFSPGLEFQLDDTRLALAQDAGLDESSNPLTPSQFGSGARESTATIGAFGLDASIETARRAGIIGVATALVTLLGALCLMYLPRRRERDIIAARHGAWLIRADRDGEPAERRIRLTNMDDLIRVAELRGHPVLESDEDDRTLYIVDAGVVQYCYETEPSDDPDATIATRNTVTPCDEVPAEDSPDPLQPGAEEPQPLEVPVGDPNISVQPAEGSAIPDEELAEWLSLVEQLQRAPETVGYPEQDA